MHERWTDQLSAWLADELSPADRRDLEAHLAECPACRQVLAELQAVVAWAPAYRGEEPERDLWPAIAAEIERSRSAVFPAARRFSLGQMAAAAAVVAVLAGGGVWLTVRGVSPADPAGPGAAPAVFQAAQLDDPAFDAAVVELEQVLAEGREMLDTATVRIIEQNLQVIDAAIDEARAAIEADPSNAYLGARIRTNMQRKLVLLRQAARAVGTAS